jgi:hypothetical protein
MIRGKAIIHPDGSFSFLRDESADDISAPPSKSEIKKLLRDPDVGVNVARSMQAIRAIAASVLATQPTPLLRDMAMLVAKVAGYGAVIGGAASAGRIRQSNMARAITAALITVDGLATKEERGFRVHESDLFNRVLDVVESSRSAFKTATSESREALLLDAEDRICALTNVVPERTLVTSALLARGRGRKPKGNHRTELKWDVYFDLVKNVGLEPETPVALEQAYRRWTRRKR